MSGRLNSQAGDAPKAIASPGDVAAFIERWQAAGGTERANYQLFLTELCALLELGQPAPASEMTQSNTYVFERRVDIQNVDGTTSRGYIDLYRRGCFVLEAKQTGKTLDTQGWDKAMLAAHNQADQYVRALPAGEGRPPFILVTDVGRSLEIYSEFTRSGGTYVPFPDPGHHRIRLEDLHRPEIQARLHTLWSDPEALDSSRQAARVTREVSTKLAVLARDLEQAGYAVERVARFLMRSLFTMFAEDVDLLPANSFSGLLERLQKHPEHFVDSMHSLWATMDTGGYEGQLMEKLKRFNGGLFLDIEPIALTADQIQLVIDAARADWRFVEPAIFGTLLERALDPKERHKLGAHYTPRGYVERLVMPTIIEPLRREWRNVQAVAAVELQRGSTNKAVKVLREFHRRLCTTRILDPACGSGNFLYVALEQMKRLEGEVVNTIRDLSAGQIAFDTQGLTIDPHQFLGLELNPRAATIAEMVLWIGYLQWHYRLYGSLTLPEPILRDFHNIENRDALFEYDSRRPMRDEYGDLVTVWDGISYKTSPVTGELVPDELGRTTVYEYINPRRASWPAADYIVGNPPFVGEKRMREALGDGYVTALRKTYFELPACDLVMYWWHKAAETVAVKTTRGFGFITTNTITQSKNRTVQKRHLDRGIAIVFAIPDHPWVDSSDGAAVRIAMTASIQGPKDGLLRRIRFEENTGGEARNVGFNECHGRIFADLTVGAPLLEAQPLASNGGLVFQGVKLVGNGFLVTPDQRRRWLETHPEWRRFVPRLIAGNDLTRRRPARYCIDFYGLSERAASEACPLGFQKVLTEVKPHRDCSSDTFFREHWWVFGRSRGEMRDALRNLSRYVATSEVSKHRYFVFLDVQDTLADGSLAVVALADAFHFGVLNSRLHIRWALGQGGRHSTSNNPRWQNGACFLNFPFPQCSTAYRKRITEIAERLNTHRERQQVEHPTLTLTDMYNVLEKLRSGEALTSKDRTVHDQGVVSVMRELHDELDRAVFSAYGWDELAEQLVGRPGATTPYSEKREDQAVAEEELLTRLVLLNRQRAAEEARGHVRWLRPAYQAPNATQQAVEYDSTDSKGEAGATDAAFRKVAWPKTPAAQVEAVRAELGAGPQTLNAVAGRFKNRPVKSVGQLLNALEVLGQAKHENGVWNLV